MTDQATSPRDAAFARWMRPRGDSVSSPVSKNVGQLSRQNPHRMHRLAKSSIEAFTFG
jgi:hypothetical protein